MKVPARTKSRIRQRMFDARSLMFDVVAHAETSAFSVGRWTLDVSFIYFSSATFPSRLRARTRRVAALPCAAGGQLPGWRYSLGYCNRRRFFCRATTQPEIAAAIHSTGL